MQDIFIKRLLRLMEEENITQVELANRVGITNVTISRYLSGERSPRIEIVVKLAEYFHVSTDYLLGVSPFRTTPKNSLPTDFSNYLHSRMNALGLLNADKKLSKAQVKMIEKLIEANKDFIANLKEDNKDAS